MDFVINPLTIEERKYTYAQSTQIRSQTGSIGHLRGDFGSGEQFYTTWDEHDDRLKTPEFSSELDDVINELRSNDCGLLKSRRSMAAFARKNPESSFKGAYTTEYGFRVDTEKHSYLLRCNPTQGDYNFYCFCYQREWLDKHIDRARQDIRFIDSHYKELFRLPDGGQITVIGGDGEKRILPADISTKHILRSGITSTTSVSLPSEWSEAATLTNRRKHPCPVSACQRFHPQARL